MKIEVLRIVVSVQAHRALQALATTDRRTLGSEVAWLIAQEAESRASALIFLGPEPPASPSPTDESPTAPTRPPTGNQT